MTIKETFKEYEESFKQEVLKVLKGEMDTVTSEIPMNLSNIDKFLREQGCDQGETKSNGWQYDFWTNYSFEGNTFDLAGSGWYADNILFSKSEL